MFSRFDPDDSEGEESNFQSGSMRFMGDDAAITHGVTMSRRGMEPGEQGERRVHSTFVLGRPPRPARQIRMAIRTPAPPPRP
jgi:hypothetical protein